MQLTGGCYCGDVRYQVDGEPVFQGQCHCRECQYFTGGHPNVLIGFKDEDFSFTRGEPKGFARTDIDFAANRLFCPNCGTPIGTRSPGLPGATILKVGTLDDPSVFKPQMAIYTKDAQPFHQIPEGVPSFEGQPGG